MNIKQKVRIKIRQMSIDTFSNQIMLELIDCLFSFIQIKMQIIKELKLIDIIYQKVLLIVITASSMEKTLMIKQLLLI